MGIYNRLMRWYVGETIRLVVDDIYEHPERYSLAFDLGTYVYRNGKKYMYIYSSGKIELLNRQYGCIKAKIIHRALVWALHNGCTVG